MVEGAPLMRMPIDRWQPGTEPLGHGVQDIGTWQGTDFSTTAKRILAIIASQGIRVPSGNRLELAYKTIVRVNCLNVQFGPSDRPMEEVVIEASRTIFEHWVIVELLGDVVQALGSQITKMLGGPEVPRKGRDPARDKQAELFAAALLQASGYTVEFAEPDLILSASQGESIGVAVKRLTSEANANKQLDRARRQLRANNFRGFIMVNAERLLTELYWQRRHADLGAALNAKTSEWIAYCDRRDSSFHVLGVLGLATMFRYQTSTRTFENRLVYVSQFLVPSADEGDELAPRIRRMIDDMMEVLSQAYNQVSDSRISG